MVKLSKDILDDITKVKIIPLSTCSCDNIPNVVPIGIFDVDTNSSTNDFIYIMDNYFLKTMSNILENPHVSFYIWSIETQLCTQIKGNVISILKDGYIYDNFVQKIKLIKPNLPFKQLLIIEITEVFNCKAGINSGKKLILSIIK